MTEKIPLFISCQRHGCENIRSVRHAYEQRIRRFCSRSCASKVTRNLHRLSPQAFGAMGGKVSAERRRAAMFVKIQGLTPMQAYRKGRQEGWHAGERAMLKRLARRAA